MGVGRRSVAVAVATGFVLLGGVAGAGPASPATGRLASPPVEDGTPPPPNACKYLDKANVRSGLLTGDVLAARTWPQNRIGYLDVHRYTRGRGVVVAVVDSGVDGRHPQLRGAVQRGVDVTRATPVAGADTDCAAHGTAVAGIIAARPVPGTGLVGIAPEATILPIRHLWGVSRYGSATSAPAEALLRGLRTAVTSRVSIVNVSVSVAAETLTAAQRAEFARLARVAEANDILVVVASGNRDEYENKNPTTYPAALSTVSPVVMAVSGVRENGRPDENSITGPFVSVAAPDWNVPCPLDHGGVVLCRGTSFGTPFVAGLAALVRSRFPELRAAEVRARIQATADRPAADVPDPRVGFGVIDPMAALTAVLPPAALPSEPVPARPLQPAPADEAMRRTTTAVVAGSVGLVALVLAGWATARRGRRRRWRPGPGAGSRTPVAETVGR